MNFTHFTVQKDDENRRLDRLVRKFLPEEPLSRIHKSIRSGIIRVNGCKKDASFRVSEGERLEIADFLLQKKYKGDENQKSVSSSAADVSSFFTDVFVNKDIRIINKAYGVPVQGGSRNTVSVDVLIKAEYVASRVNRADTSLSFKPGPLHRIDRRTSGLVCFSQSLQGARLFSQSLVQQCIKKEYLAVLQGKLTEPIEAEHFIERIGENNAVYGRTTEKEKKQSRSAFKTVRILKTDIYAGGQFAMHGKKASSLIEPLAVGRIEEKNIDCTLARVTIKTGRTHQIRAQSAFCGFPLLGDTAYGAKSFRFPDTKEGLELFLHAASLIFGKDNPLNIPCRISAPLPFFFQRFIEKYLPATDVSTYTASDETD